MTEPRIIKKYPNRRLYDTTVSTYITLEQIRQLVIDQVEIQIKDAKTNADITRSILLQVILEQEEGGEPIFTVEVLMRIIRFYGNSAQSMASNYLEQSLALFTEQQEMFQEQVKQSVVDKPLSAMSELTEKNVKIWQDMQNNFLTLSGFTADSNGKKGDKEES